MVKPETVVFIRKVMLTTVILGTLLALIIVVLQSCASTIQHGNAKLRDSAIATNIAKVSESRRPLYEQTVEGERQLGTLPPGSDAARNLGVIYEKYGQQLLNENDTTHAEQAFQRAVQLDPQNPHHYSNLGRLYSQIAAATPAPADRGELLVQSGDNWAEAKHFSSDDKSQSEFGEAAAQSYLQAVQSFQGAGTADSHRLRQLLMLGREAAPAGSPTQDLLKDALRQFGGF